MSSWSKLKKFLIIPAAALGVVALFIAVKSKQGPQKADVTERVRAVRVIEAKEISLIPRAVGYGYVEPNQVWKAVAEVSGKIVYIHPEMKRGSIILQDEVLFRIDPESYDLAQERGEADVESLKAQLRELDQNTANLKRSLEVEERSLVLSQKELQRQRGLYASGNISKSVLDQAEKNVLAQKVRVQNLQNSLNLIPSQRGALMAKIDSTRTRWEGTKLDLAKTTIKAPFDCRISGVFVEKDQFTPAGQVVAQADDISVAEVAAQFPISSMYGLLPANGQNMVSMDFSMQKLRETIDLKAVVRLEIVPGKIIEWPARFSRPAESLDPQTRTVGIYVTVDKPYHQVRIGKRPPLVKNMYCQVELIGHPRPKSVVIPRTALHAGLVYAADSQNRLVRREVTTDYGQGNLVTITKGLSPGELVVVTDVVPAIDGMLLKPQTDQKLMETIALEAQGKAPVK